MTSLAELAAVMMRGAQNRVDVTASNVTNLNTTSYRTHRLFSQVLDARHAVPVDMEALAVNGTAAIRQTGNPLDIATDPDAVILLRTGTRTEQSRSAQLHRDADGLLVDSLGRVLQSEGGGDVSVGQGNLTILKDGTVTSNGQAVAKIGLFKPLAGDMEGRAVPAPADGAKLHSGATVGSDVDLGVEMVELTKASRLAETGAKVFSVYDDLLGAAATKLGEMPR